MTYAAAPMSLGTTPRTYINYHCLCAKAVFLIGLEDEDCASVEITGLSQIFGCTKQHARMSIMATGVHYAIICGFVVALACLAEW